MIIESVHLRNFRNYEKADVRLNPHMNLITGQNAQGKTNFLEAVVYLSLTRSHRINDERKMIRTGCDFARIECVFEEDKQKEIEAVIHGHGKTLMIEHQPVHKSSEFVGQLLAVLFSPDDLTIFADSPRERRKWMDQEICRVSPAYLNALNVYGSLLKERNSLLKGDLIDQTLLDILDEKMSEQEVMLVRKRRNFIDCLNEYLTGFYHELAMDKETEVSVTYACAYDYGKKEDILKKRKEAREKDMQYRVTTVGIHREDMVFHMNAGLLVQYASQGQKRMTVLAVKMALLKYIEKTTGRTPVLLLDDVLSELDKEKQRKLLEMVREPYQCIITSTEMPADMQNQNCIQFVVNNGNIERIGGTADE